MECRVGCGACCIAPSISSAIPGMVAGKAAGVHCPQLDEERRCRIFGRDERPAVCVTYQASVEWCGSDASEALDRLHHLERLTTL